MDDLLQQGINAYKSGDRENARRLLIAATKQFPDDERSWGWLYNVCMSDQERIQCLKQVIRINPQNEKANQLYNKLSGFDFPLTEPPTTTQVSNTLPVTQKRTPAYRIPPVSMEKVGEYIKSILLPNEHVLAVAKIHWIVYLSPAIFAAIALLMSLCSLLQSVGLSSVANRSEVTGLTVGYFMMCSFPFWIIAGIGFLHAFLRTKFTEFALTDNRIIGKVGLIKRSSLEIVLGKVESISVNQSVIGRIFNFGTLVISGSGGTHQPIPYIAKPMELKQAINSVLAE